MKRSHFAAIALGTATLLPHGAALSADGTYPSRSIRMVVPYGPGGSVDILGRLLAQKLGEALGVSIVVENRGGGGTTIGTQVVAQAPADGYTLLLTDLAFSANPSLLPTMPYDSSKDFSPIVKVAALPAILVVTTESKSTTLAQFVQTARGMPGKLNYASSDIGSLNFLATELFKSEAGLDITHVPYQSGAQAVMALLGGQTQMLITTVPPALPHVKAGKLRVLAVADDKRLETLPDVPTFAESGYPDFKVALWQGLFAPAGTPDAVIDKLNKDVNKVLGDPEVRARIAALGGTPFGGTAAQFRDFVRADTQRWHGLIKPSMLESK